MPTAYISLGSNVGDRQQMLGKAVDLLEAHAGDVTRLSRIYATAPWGNTDQPEFLNQVLALETEQAADQLMQTILAIESDLGRKRLVKWGPRTIDIDILFLDQQIVQHPEVVLPHPYVQERRFILCPLDEIAPDLVHPVLHQTIHELLVALKDELDVHPI